MMKVLFDSSVLVAVCVEELKNHEVAADCFLRYSKSPHRGYWTTHAVAETFATLTALPLERQIQPFEARELIEQNLKSKLELVDLPAKLYDDAISRVCRLGLASGAVYDALHLEAAEAIGCDRLKTYNLKHFRRFHSEGVAVSAP